MFGASPDLWRRRILIVSVAFLPARLQRETDTILWGRGESNDMFPMTKEGQISMAFVLKHVANPYSLYYMIDIFALFSVETIVRIYVKDSKVYADFQGFLSQKAVCICYLA